MFRDAGGTVDDIMAMNFEGIVLDDDAQYGTMHRDSPIVI